MSHVLRSYFAVACSFVGVAQAALSPEEFRTPPKEARPMVLWTWLNGHVDHKQLSHELEEMKAKGLRGAIIWDLGALADPQKIIPAGPAFLGPESLKSIHHAMDEAERLGLDLGLVASSSWNAGGDWITPEDNCKALLWSEVAVEGPREFSEVLPLPPKISAHRQDVSLLAVPDLGDKTIPNAEKALRLDPNLGANGHLTWSVPAGKWRILRFMSHSSGEMLNCPSPNSRGLVIDHLSADATDAHFHHMLDALSRGRNGFGSLKMLMLDSYEVHPSTDWTPQFVKSFVAEHGYDPSPWLPVLAGWTVDTEELSQRFLHDYRKFVSDLMVEHHFVKARQLLNERGLQLLAEGGHGGYARVDPLKALGAADIPMGEFWNHRKNWVTKEAASAAHIYGKRFVNSESFTGWQNWQDGPAAYKRLFDIALCAGQNQVTFHTFAHNPPAAGLPGFAYHAGEHFNVNATWWNQAGPMLADMSRACHLLQQGKFVADVCAYYGDDAPNLVPARRIAPTIQSQWDDAHCAHCGRPKPVDLSTLGQGYDYDYINEEVLLTRMQVKEGKLVLPDGMSYRVMVLPDRKTISLAALKRIGELVKAGATIVGPKPERSNSLSGYPDCDREVQELAAEIWGNCDGEQIKSHVYGKGKVMINIPLNEVLQGMGVERDFIAMNIDNKDQHIDYIHRATDDEDIYFVSNSAMTREVVGCRFRVRADRVPSFWNAENGTVTPCHSYVIEDGFIHLTLDLAPASSIFVIFAKGEPRDPLVEIVATTESPTPAVDVVSLAQGKLAFHAWQPGTYSFKSASGRSANAKVTQSIVTQSIAGPWQLHFPPDRGAPASLTMETLTDWTKHSDASVQYFSGTATYQNKFSLTENVAKEKTPLMLDLGSVKDVAVVHVNGKPAGVLWKEPYAIDIRSLVQAGENQLEIQVVNNWNNRIIGDLRSDPKQRITRTNLSGKFNAKMPLLSSGLLGPVVLKAPVLVECELK